MPNVNISLYLNDVDYPNYSARKKELNDKARAIIKKEIASK
jgi:hypothetical protein